MPISHTSLVAARACGVPCRAADVVVDVLAQAGVEVIFGLPGGAISPVHDALLDRADLRVVTTRHESGALFAAAGYAHATGELGVAVVTSGPGVLNSMTGLASAWCDGLPVLLLVGEVPRKMQGKGALQDGSAHGLNVVGMVSHITKMAVEVSQASQLPHLLGHAIATALSGRRGPVVLTLPLDVATASILPPRVASAEGAREGAASDAVLDEVAALLAAASRPLLLAGSGVRGGAAPARLRHLAERAACPVATTPKARGVFPDDHPLALGVFGLAGHPSASAYLERGVDVIVVLGSSLGDLATDGWTPLLQASGAVVQVDIDARQIGKSYAPTHAVVAPAEEFLGGLLDRIAPRGRTPGAGGVVRHALPSSTAPARIAPQDAIAEIQEVLPPDAIYTVDAGEHLLFATHYLRTTAPDGFIVMSGLGSMGPSIGAALGAQLARPDRVVAAICGDGCFAMNAFEVATAVAERVPLLVFVFNDERLGMVEIGHQAVYGRRPSYPTAPMDVCAVASALGAATLRAASVGDIRGAAALLRARSGPVVVDVRIDPAIRLPKKDRIGAFTAGPPSLRAVG